MNSSARILIVDDERDFTLTLAAILRQHGFEVEEAENTEQAFVKIEPFDPHVVLLDIFMPGTAGSEVLKELKDWKPAMEIIMVTSAISEDVKTECLSNGAFEVMGKPVETADLKATIDNALAKHG